MTPPHAKTWSPRGRTPVVRVRGRSRRRLSIARHPHGACAGGGAHRRLSSTATPGSPSYPRSSSRCGRTVPLTRAFASATASRAWALPGIGLCEGIAEPSAQLVRPWLSIRVATSNGSAQTPPGRGSSERLRISRTLSHRAAGSSSAWVRVSRPVRSSMSMRSENPARTARPGSGVTEAMTGTPLATSSQPVKPSASASTTSAAR